MGLPYPEQLRRKRERLLEALGRYPHLDLSGRVEAIVGAVRTEGYRHRLKLPVAVGQDHVRIGLYGANHEVLDTPDCPVLAPELRAALPPLLAWLRGRRGVHSLDLRRSAATGELMAVLACDGGELPGGARGARELRRAVPGLASIAVSRADPEGRRVMGAAPRVVAGAAAIEEAIGPTRYLLHPGAFFQVDPLQAEALHRLVRELVGPARRVLDLYAGVGAYALMLAPHVERVVMVEEVPQAAEAARRKAPPNVEVHAAKVEHLELAGRFDAAILNPARRGSDPASLARLARLTDRLVYVSCGPETLARDLDALAAHGLRVKRVIPVDLFPQTPEVETVVLLARGEPLVRWKAGPGWATGPWLGGPSGATGRPARAVALLIGDVRASGTLDGGRFTRIGTVATHSLVRLETRSLGRALATLAARGHPVAGRDPRTARFFAEKAGLVRPFVHVERDADGVEAPLHGDLAEALRALGGVGPARPAERRRRRER